MKVCYVWKPQIEEGGWKARKLSTLISEYNALTAPQKAALLCVEIGNEPFPGGTNAENKITKATWTGKQYGEAFLAAAAEQETAQFPIPIILKTRLDRTILATWMESLGEVNRAALTKALEAKPSWLPNGNYLGSHPYYGNMMSPQKEPNNLGSGGENSFLDTQGVGAESKWGGQRWMKEQQFIKNITGLTVPMVITEYGTGAKPGQPNSVGKTGNVTGSWQAVAKHAEEFFNFAKLVKEVKVPSSWLPTGLTPTLVAAIWYDEYAWSPNEGEGGEESYGFLESVNGPGAGKVTGAPNEVGSFYATFKLWAQALSGTP
jgi:hypothetical protein